MMLQQIIFMRAIKTNLWCTIIFHFFSLSSLVLHCWYNDYYCCCFIVHEIFLLALPSSLSFLLCETSITAVIISNMTFLHKQKVWLESAVVDFFSPDEFSMSCKSLDKLCMKNFCVVLFCCYKILLCQILMRQKVNEIENSLKIFFCKRSLSKVCLSF